ncbi:MAG: 2-isopropylmalate synthase [Rhizobacter sp.]|nr:2-isopropylmalate synthase [Rhizobacter sp.]
MLKNPSTKYRPFPVIDMPDRQWPSRTITAPPLWMSTDLRDGNQALFEPMNAERKLQMFELLVSIGFKEIEVGYPAASETDFGFIRKLIDEKRIPADVTIIVLTPAREDLIRRTMESLRGAPRATVHLYNATSPVFRRVVFNMTLDEVVDLAVTHTKLVRALCNEQSDTKWGYEYSPETFTATELDFAVRVCDAVVDAWGGTPTDKVILNLPATVEVCTANIYADQIEWMHRHLAKRDAVVLSVHPHNDRGTGVAAAEMAVMAGADRVEGCLFGNGERTGNVDLVTLALNLYSQGIDPGLDFSDIDSIARVAEHCTQLPVHPRHPYAGDLVFTAFSGSHQDAIKKGFAVQKADSLWEVPYLPIDPADVGRGYDAIVRVNSQSGKGGIAFLLESGRGLVLPRRQLVEFSGVVQRVTDDTGQEVTADALWDLFDAEYLQVKSPVRYVSHRITEGDKTAIALSVEIGGKAVTLQGAGNGPIDAALNALGAPATLYAYEERGLGQGSNATACAFVELGSPVSTVRAFGAGVNEHIVTASIMAVISAFDRLVQQEPDVMKRVAVAQGLEAASASAGGNATAKASATV